MNTYLRTIAKCISVLIFSFLNFSSFAKNAKIHHSGFKNSIEVANLTLNIAAPVLTKPETGKTYASQIPVSLYFSETVSSVSLTFNNIAGTYSNTLILTSTQSGTFTITTTNLAGDPNVISSTHTDLPDGTYNVTLTYTGILAGTLSTTNSNVTIQTATPTPTLTSPTTGFVFSSNLSPTFTYTIPSAPLSGTVSLTLTPTTGSGYNYVLPNTNGTGTYTITSNFPVDGTYTATVSYQDFLSNPASTSAPISVNIDTHTVSPTLIKPASSTQHTTQIPISLTLGEIPAFATSRLIFTNTAGTYSNTLILANSTLSQTFTLTTNALDPNSSIFSTTYNSLPNDYYNITLAYQDARLNPVTAVVNSNILIQSSTPIPSITSPSSGAVFSSVNSPVFNYNIPSAPLSGTVSLTLTPTTGVGYSYVLPNTNGTGTYTITSNFPVDGTYTATVSYQDFLSNPASTSAPISLIIDTYTISPTLNTPASFTQHATQIPISLTLGEMPAIGTSRLIFTNTAGTYSNTLILANNTLSQTFTLTTNSLIPNSSILSTTYNSLPNDYYNITLAYQDIRLNPVTAVVNSNVLIQSSTPTPILTSPTTGFVFSSNLSPTFTYIIPSAPLSGTVSLTLTPTTGVGYSYVLPNTNGTGTYTITSNIPPDGTYTATVSYQDFLSNPASTSSLANIKFDYTTLTPSIATPLTNSVSTGTSTITYTLPESALSGSKQIKIAQNGTTLTTLIVSDVNTATLSLNFKNLVSTLNSIASVTGTSSIPDGTYSVTFSYQDLYSNAVASASINLTLDTRTEAPIVSSPLSGNSYSSKIPISLTLGEPYLAGSAKIIFVNSNNLRDTLTLVDNILSQTFTITTKNVLNTNIISTTKNIIPDEVYSIIIQYQDQYGNPVNSVTISNITIQNATPVPSITSPINGAAFSGSSKISISYNLPSTPYSGTALLTLAPGYTYPLTNTQVGTYTISSNSPLDGTYTCTISYQDFLGNPTASSSIKLIVQRVTPSPKIIAPISKAYFSTYIFYKDSIPVANASGTKKLTILKDTSLLTTIILKDVQSDSIYFNIHHLSESMTSIQSITGVDSLVDGMYILKLSYQDIYGNPTTSTIDTIYIDSAPLIGVLSHQNNIVYGPFNETLAFNKPVTYLSNNPIIPGLINDKPSATLGSLSANATNSTFTFLVTPLQEGTLKLLSPFVGIAYDIAGNPSQIIATDSIKYIDTTKILTPLITGNLSFCQGDSTILTSSTANTYLWSNGATTKSIVIKQSGTYSVKTNYDNHIKGISNNYIVTQYSIPSVPTLKRDSANNLVSSYINGNTWYKEGVALKDSTQKIKPSAAGSYTVKTSQNGCVSSLSTPYYYLVTDVIILSKDEFIKLSPNPFTNQLNFDFLVNGYQSLNMEVFDISTGTKVASKQSLMPGIPINLGQLSAGTYVIKISSTDNKIVQQFKVVKL